MTQVTFYMLEAASDSSKELLACMLAAQLFRTKRRCLVLCSDQKSAENFDELLWRQPMDAFVPHNLTGEGPANGAPVEISWVDEKQITNSQSRQVLINLTDALPEDGQKFRQIIDFVPAVEETKQAARDRYKQYRASGFQMSTAAASSINEIQNG